MKEILSITESISQDKILNSETFDQLDIDLALDSRDSPDFETDWLRVHKLMMDQKNNGESDAIEALRRLAYEKVFEHTSNPELASYVSDDLGLIGLALELGENDPWLSSLWNEYRNHRFPHTRLEPYPGTSNS
ncbi:hypothetical protein Pla110_41710 [Polystyrenella longa]|uniref:Uncharacterized protein n=1 Tax=Polystyrenella longa TaxID=2528007 RepID=A0A518CT82_9PLAN|nr:hypothetical protein [Polystyrenella longa]QDU82415.1 hypothetical protein Pla110_41710 [Polystyrenella longa]